MEILDVTSFAGKASVEHWLEDDVEDGKEDVQMDLYWRQTFDHRTLQLSVSLENRHSLPVP
jgi:chloramphenicol 3-O-phosphotransferase